METILERVMKPYKQQENKHEKGEGWAENTVNAMTNMQLLELISEAHEEFVKAERYRNGDE